MAAIAAKINIFMELMFCLM